MKKEEDVEVPPWTAFVVLVVLVPVAALVTVVALVPPVAAWLAAGWDSVDEFLKIL